MGGVQIQLSSADAKYCLLGLNRVSLVVTLRYTMRLQKILSSLSVVNGRLVMLKDIIGCIKGTNFVPELLISLASCALFFPLSPLRAMCFYLGMLTRIYS